MGTIEFDCVNKVRAAHDDVEGLTEPFVVGLVKPLVANRMMFPAVNPVDAIVREDKEA